MPDEDTTINDPLEVLASSETMEVTIPVSEPGIITLPLDQDLTGDVHISSLSSGEGISVSIRENPSMHENVSMGYTTAGNNVVFIGQDAVRNSSGTSSVLIGTDASYDSSSISSLSGWHTSTSGYYSASGYDSASGYAYSNGHMGEYNSNYEPEKYEPLHYIYPEHAYSGLDVFEHSIIEQEIVLSHLRSYGYLDLGEMKENI